MIARRRLCTPVVCCPLPLGARRSYGGARQSVGVRLVHLLDDTTAECRPRAACHYATQVPTHPHVVLQFVYLPQQSHKPPYNDYTITHSRNSPHFPFSPHLPISTALFLLSLCYIRCKSPHNVKKKCIIIFFFLPLQSYSAHAWI